MCNLLQYILNITRSYVHALQSLIFTINKHFSSIPLLLSQQVKFTTLWLVLTKDRGVFHPSLMALAHKCNSGPNVDGYVSYDVCKTQIVSLIAPIATSPWGRKVHCATALDDSSPVLENTSGDNVYIFGIDIWSTVADVGKCH